MSQQIQDKKKAIKLVSCVLSDHNGIKSSIREITKKIGLNNTFFEVTVSQSSRNQGRNLRILREKQK